MAGIFENESVSIILEPINNQELIVGNPVLLEKQDIIDDQLVSVAAMLKEKNDVLKYEYDFGDGWMHEILMLYTKGGV